MPQQATVKVGRSYLFTISGHIIIPGTHVGNWVLTGPGKKKYLLEEQYYTHYHLQIGQRIRCHVDKMNCSGRIFLEPQHPYYVVRKTYDFPVTRVSEPIDVFGRLYYLVTLKDVDGRNCSCMWELPEGAVSSLTHLTCKVDHIEKGALYLTDPVKRRRHLHLKQGRKYKFTVKEVTFIGEDKYYILKDTQGISHHLLFEDYSHYSMQIDDVIEATVKRHDLYNLQCVIEPVHPYYNVGEIYPFRFVKLAKSTDAVGNKQAVIHVEDIYKKSIKVKPLDWQIEAENFCPGEIKCMVTQIKKGKPALLVVDQAPTSQ
jgi:hypothetical protein